MEGARFQRGIVPVTLMTFLNAFALAMVIPLFATLMLSPKFGIELGAFSLFTRSYLLGLLIGAFPLFQYIGLSLYTWLGTRLTTRAWITLSLLGFILTFSLSAIAIMISSFTLLILARVGNGLFAGNAILCLSYQCDDPSSAERRSKSLFQVAILGMCGGILLSGILSNPFWDPRFSSSFPFWVAAFISLVFIGFTLWVGGRRKIDAFSMLATCKLRSLFHFFWKGRAQKIILINILYLFAWFAILQFYSLFFIEEFHATHTFVCTTLIFLAIAFFLGFFWFAPFLGRLEQNAKKRLLFLLGSAIGCSLLMALSSIDWVSSLFHICFAFYSGAIWVEGTKQIHAHSQSETCNVLSYKLSCVMLAAFITPIISGFILSFGVWTIYLLTTVSLILSFIISLTLNEQNRSI